MKNFVITYTLGCISGFLPSLYGNPSRLFLFIVLWVVSRLVERMEPRVWRNSDADYALSPLSWVFWLSTMMILLSTGLAPALPQPYSLILAIVIGFSFGWIINLVYKSSKV